MASSPYTIYAALVQRDVQEHPTHYNATVRSDPEAHAYRLTEDLTPDEVRRLTRELRAERDQLGAAPAPKGQE